MSWIIGRSAGSTQPSLGRVSLSLHSYQNPQFGMTINKISPSPYPTSRKTIHWIVLLGRVTRGEGIKPPPRNQRFRSSRKGWTFCAFSLLFTPSAIRHAVSLGSYFTGSTSVPSPPHVGGRGYKSPLLEITDFGPPARGGHFVLFHSFFPPQPYGTQFHTAHSLPVQLVSLALPT